MASLLPRDTQSLSGSKPQGDLPSPSEDLNATVTKLLEQQTHLEEKVEELEGDKRHFQNKLDEYIRYDREEGQSSNSRNVAQLERRVSELLAEKAELQTRLSMKDEEISSLYSSQPQATDRGHRAHLIQRLNDLQASMQANKEHYGHQINALKLENLRLEEEVKRLRSIHSQYQHLQTHRNVAGYAHDESVHGNVSSGHTRAEDGHGSVGRGSHAEDGHNYVGSGHGHAEGGCGYVGRGSHAEDGHNYVGSGHGHAEGGRGYFGSGHGRVEDVPASWERNHWQSKTEGHTSLPESLDSRSSGGSSDQTCLTATLTEMTLTTNPSPPPPPTPSPDPTTAAELKKLKKQLEKYKTANIDLDEKLKDAKLELRKYAERGSEGDVRYLMDCERLRSEHAQLRSQLDRALGEIHHLRSLVGRRY